MATEGTAAKLLELGATVAPVQKISEGVPNILDVIRSGTVELVIDLPRNGGDINKDGFQIRRTAAESRVSLLTAIDTVGALLKVLESGLT